VTDGTEGRATGYFGGGSLFPLGSPEDFRLDSRSWCRKASIREPRKCRVKKHCLRLPARKELGPDGEARAFALILNFGSRPVELLELESPRHTTVADLGTAGGGPGEVRGLSLTCEAYGPTLAKSTVPKSVFFQSFS